MVVEVGSCGLYITVKIHGHERVRERHSEAEGGNDVTHFVFFSLQNMFFYKFNGGTGGAGGHLLLTSQCFLALDKVVGTCVCNTRIGT